MIKIISDNFFLVFTPLSGHKRNTNPGLKELFPGGQNIIRVTNYQGVQSDRPRKKNELKNLKKKQTSHF